MSPHPINKNLLLLRDRIISNLYEKTKTDKEILEEIREIFVAAPNIIEKAKNEQELIAFYDMIATQLEIVSNDCENFGNTKLAYTQRQISTALHECIEPYLPHNIKKSELIKILWPHNCWDIVSLKNVFLNYIFESALMFEVDDIFTDEFISIYKMKIKNAKNIKKLIRVCEDIKEDARLAGLEYHTHGNHEEAWKYVVLSRIIGFLLSDFEHCLKLPIGTFKWVGSSSVYL